MNHQMPENGKKDKLPFKVKMAHTKYVSQSEIISSLLSQKYINIYYIILCIIILYYI